MNNCIVCGNSILSKNKKYCSETCRNRYKYINNKNKYNNLTYTSQKDRGYRRKLYYIQKLGGKCSVCGYDKNFGSLHFHHKGNKEVGLDVRKMGNMTLEKLDNEIQKCILLCSNCHGEVHYPRMNKETIFKNNKLEEISDISFIKLRSKHPIKAKNTLKHIYVKQKNCSRCNKEICNQNKSGLCIKCSREKPKLSIRKVERPTKDVLKTEMVIYNWNQLGIKYGINYKNVKKWAKKYELI